MNYKIPKRGGGILMIEDNPLDFMLIKKEFEFSEFNCEVYVAEDAIEAMAFLNQQGQYAEAPQPDIILLDLNIPNKNGLEILIALKAGSNIKNIPVIIYSSSVSHKDINAAYINCANCYIRKPVDFDGCIKVVNAIQSLWFNVVTLPILQKSL